MPTITAPKSNLLLCGRYLFFSVVGSNSPGIMRCDLACQDPEHIVDTNDVTSLTADSER